MCNARLRIFASERLLKYSLARTGGADVVAARSLEPILTVNGIEKVLRMWVKIL